MANRRLSANSPRFTIETTEDLIAGATRKNSGHCVWADALRAARPDAQRISVDLQTIRFTEGDKRYVYLTPRIVQVDLVRFDQGLAIEPKECQLRGAQVLRKGSNPEPTRLQNVEGVRAKRPGVPVKVGGKSPPLGALNSARGIRRSFGLRAMEL